MNIRDELTESTFWDLLSEVVGWSYVIVWSISFYPQAYLNWKRKSVRGLSIDFVSYNVLGFFCYSIYNLSFYFNDQIKHEYHKRHPHSENSLVRLNDVVFSVHGFLLSFFILLQACIYKKHRSQHISSFAASFVWLNMIAAVLLLATTQYGGATSIDFMYFLSSVMLAVSFIKYLPQVWLNYRRQSTQGWSIEYIRWDLSGGILSIFQLLLDAYIDGDWSGIEGDNVKL
ncbi:PQ loop repeat-domain-containing protein [Gilbertella persicaria]|uniref:PQ loop repeat-domain-containing protein n=1 Tax=Gilbertella persicaria TaxID=101096 RepID=UPI00222073D6|nr:PQ loop repeat-domain-containing protein [Gilbertella persicaria]KAI8078135.1 PQ loop repeat-domain-containing protein [Gilbertella persicaria]